MGWIWSALGVALTATAAWLAAGRRFGQVAPWPRRLGSFVLAWAWVTLGSEGLGSFGLLRAESLVGWSAFGLLLALVGGRAGRGRGVVPAPEGRGEPFGLASTLALGLVFWADWRWGLLAGLDPVKVVSDGPIYHLYFAARWWKAGRVFAVASPFGEVGATYFWANGELWYAWLMTLWGGDRLAKLGQVPFLLVAAATTYATSLRLGAGRPAALLASCWFASIMPLLLFAFEPNVDVLFTSAYLLACYFFLRHAMGDDEGPALALGALAAGLGLGTKPTGVVFFPPLLALVASQVASRSISVRRKAGHLLLLVLAPALMAGYWPIRNAWLTGNPLYPLQVEAFGRVWLRGWFGPGAMASSPYYLPATDWRALVDTLMAVIDPRLVPAWVAAILGGWAIGRRRSPDARWAWPFAALALLNVALYWLVIPYRTQQRFMLHALGLATVPLALLFDRGAWIRGAAAGLLALHLLTPVAWPVAVREAEIPWDLSRDVPNAVPAAINPPFDTATIQALASRWEFRSPLWVNLVLGVGSMAMAWAWLNSGRERSPVRWPGALAGTLVVGVLGAWAMGGGSRLPVPAFPDFVAGWMQLESRSGPAGVRVAYAGTNIPYYLMGGMLRNDVRYVNVDAHRDWLMHDYHRASADLGLPSTWPSPFPGWDRARPDYPGWLGNLRDGRIDVLVVTRVNPAEGAHNVADRDLFPIEKVWAEAHPEAFAPLYGVAEGNPKIRLYRLLPGKSPGGSTDRPARPH